MICESRLLVHLSGSSAVLSVLVVRINVAGPHQVAVIVSVLWIDRKDVEPESPSVASLNGAAPESAPFSVAGREDAVLDAVAVVLLPAMKAVHDRRDHRRLERIGLRVGDFLVRHLEFPMTQLVF